MIERSLETSSRPLIGATAVTTSDPERQKRVCLVQSGLGAGGTEKVLACLATHLDAAGYAVTILAIHGCPSTAYYNVPKRVRVRTMQAEWRDIGIRQYHRRVLWIRQAIREQDLVLSCLTRINILTALAALGLGIVRVASERNNFRRQRMNPIWRAAMPIALATANIALMQTEAARDALPRWARKRAKIVPNPASLPPMETVGTPLPRLVAVGRLDMQKGFDTLIRSLAIARRRGHALPLTIYGVGPQGSVLADLAKTQGVSDLVTFAGRSDVPHGWTSDPGIFVLSSRFEGFPNVLIEAMSRGFAVLATRCDWGPSEIVTDEGDGLLIAVDDADAMADALIRLAEDPALRLRLATAAQRRSRDFAEDAVMSRWEEIIAEAIDSAPRQSASVRR